MLHSTKELSRTQLRVDRLIVDTDGIDLTQPFLNVGLKFKVGSKEHSIEKLGTGHQSAVVMDLYRQLGETTNKFVLYLFEEPDNHLHPTSMRAMADDLNHCADRPNSQVFLTTHSAHMLNMFPVRAQLALTAPDRLTKRRAQAIRKTDKQLRDAISRSGLTIAEAMLSRKVALVEGPGDVTLLRTLIEFQTGRTAEQHGLHIAFGSGKSGITPLAAVLQELGANFVALFDWDASQDTHLPIFKTLTASERAILSANLSTVAAQMRSISAGRSPRPRRPLIA